MLNIFDAKDRNSQIEINQFKEYGPRRFKRYLRSSEKGAEHLVKTVHAFLATTKSARRKS